MEKKRPSDKSLTPSPTKESRDHKADLPGAVEIKKPLIVSEKRYRARGKTNDSGVTSGSARAEVASKPTHRLKSTFPNPGNSTDLYKGALVFRRNCLRQCDVTRWPR